MATRTYNILWWTGMPIVVAAVIIASLMQHKWIPMTVAFVVTAVLTVTRFRELNKQPADESSDD